MKKVNIVQKKVKIEGLFFILPALLFLSLSVVFPLFKIFQYSFYKYSIHSNSSVFVGLEHYWHIFSDNLFWISLKNTLIFTIVSIILHLVISYPIATLLNTKWPNIKVRNFFRGVLIFPFLFSAPAAALLWGILFRPLGYLNYIIQALFGTTLSFLGDPNIALFSVILVNGWIYFPLYMILILGGLQSIPKSMYEASRMDGASGFQSFWYITIPQMYPLTITIILIDFATTFIQFDLVWTMTRGGPLYSTYLLSFFVYNKGLQEARFGYGSAVSLVIVIIVSLAVALYLIPYFKRLEDEP